MLMLLVVALVALCYFGGNYCPSVLKQNKKMLLGVVVGLALCSFMGVNLEGLNGGGDPTREKQEVLEKEGDEADVKSMFTPRSTPAPLAPLGGR